MMHALVAVFVQQHSHLGGHGVCSEWIYRVCGMEVWPQLDQCVSCRVHLFAGSLQHAWP